ncbi:hypothetical protein DVH24_034413 [Malus domestica]|uniref:FF domain-containing protein n=1 Tax=Malus domestica TaxID=3750 RepID=A0A498J138_MALDO|nr:hypothetical protein DVH24_034413 [Malus domestica]
MKWSTLKYWIHGFDNLTLSSWYKGKSRRLKRGVYKTEKRHWMNSKQCWKYVVICSPKILLLYIKLHALSHFRIHGLNSLQECSELMSSIRWGKVESIFENDERFKAVEQDRDRREMFKDYVGELQKKERAKAQEERKRNVLEYRRFLESCDFIKRLMKNVYVLKKLIIWTFFSYTSNRKLKLILKCRSQSYLLDLQKEKEQQKKIHNVLYCLIVLTLIFITEELRKTECKNRNEFRKLMEEHLTEGTLMFTGTLMSILNAISFETSKFVMKTYIFFLSRPTCIPGIASNTSGATPKDLFDDVVAELTKQVIKIYLAFLIILILIYMKWDL